MVFHRILDSFVRVAGLLVLVVVALARPPIRENWIELERAATYLDDRLHVHVRQSHVHVPATNQRKPAVGGGRDGIDLSQVEPAEASEATAHGF